MEPLTQFGNTLCLMVRVCFFFFNPFILPIVRLTVVLLIITSRLIETFINLNLD